LGPSRSASGSVSNKYGSGTVPDPDPSIIKQKIVRKSLISTSVANQAPVFGAFLTLNPGWVKSQDPDPGFRIRDEQPGSHYLELRNHFLS
jgi:hypothetical protein